ncbi:MAG: DUF1611 domain-containing protein [Alphaproteobacteria bacterium]|nr:DUF1611 domain-containing protein [Alphaproteobacteria bacterium]
MSEIRHPYFLFLGEAPDQLAAKTSIGVGQWRPEWCVGQLRLPGCKADSGFPDLSVEEAARKGAKTMIVGTTSRGGVFAEHWLAPLKRALELGMDLAAGLHKRLNDVPALAETARRHGRRIFDVRHPSEEFPIATGAKRPGKRLLTVGTDCSIGKMYTTLALEKEMHKRGLKADFRATGQTGVLIAGSGVAIDAVVSDFVAGCVETLAPANDPDHWDLIEGQGSLFHASYAGVTMALIHGSQPDALVMCHEPKRPHMRGLPHYKLPDLQRCIDVNVAAARLTNAKAKCVAVSLNTSALTAKAAERAIKSTEDKIGLPTVDPARTGVGRIVDRLVKLR